MSPDASIRSDILRQSGVLAAVTFMIIGAMVGTGLFGGTEVDEVQDGALSADATVLAPDSPAFSIWSVIYVLMIAYAVWQALPSQRSRERQRRAGWWISLTAVLNGLWLVAAQFFTLLTTVVAIVLLLIVLAITIRVLVAHRPESPVDSVLMDVTVGLHLGWVALATVANITAWLAADVAPASWADAAEPIGIAVLAVVAVIGIAIGVSTRGRLAPSAAMAWGLMWIGVGRTAGEPESTPVAITAFVAAAVVILTPIGVLLTGRGRGELPRGEVRTRTTRDR
jgi:hypothetical protein